MEDIANPAHPLSPLNPTNPLYTDQIESYGSYVPLYIGPWILFTLLAIILAVFICKLTE